MPEQGLKDKTVKGVVWSSVERFSVQGVQFLVMLIIARILAPKDFGLVGMLAIFMAVAQTLIDSGFSQALIRKQDRTETDNSTVFYFNIVASTLLYLLLYAVAPWVADFYEEPQLCNLMRVLCLVVVINSFGVVQRAIYTALIDFKTQAKASFVAAVVSGGVGIYLAITGYGVWTLVWQQLLNAGINTLLLWILSSWRPQWLYSWKSFNELFSFGSKLLASALLDTIFTNMYTLVIGKIFNSVSLGYYSQSDRFAKLPSSNLTGIIQRVTYPVLCSLQDDNERLRENYRKMLRLSAFIIFPVMCFLAGVAYPLISFLLGAKWEYTATLLIPLCFTMMWYPIHGINLNLLEVKGRSDLFLRLEIIKKCIAVLVLILSVPYGLLFMCWSGFFSSLACLFVNTYYTGELIQVGFKLQMRDLFGILFLSTMVFLACSFICDYVANNVFSIILSCVVSIALYAIFSFTFCKKDVEFLRSVIKK